MSKQITFGQWCEHIEHLKSSVENGGLVTARIFNSGRSLALEGVDRVCSAQVSLDSDEDDNEGLRYFPRVDIVSGTALCGDLDTVIAGVKIYLTVCAAASNCQDLLRGIVVVRQR